MSERTNPQADAQVAEALEKLRAIQKVFAKTPDRDLPFCTPVTHVLDHAHDPERLKRYGREVIGTRNFHFAMLTAIKAYWNIQMYLDGVSSGSVFSLPAAARAQIELFAIAWHVYDIVAANAGFEKPDLQKRMLAVDEALIMAIHGTRSGQVMELYTGESPSKLRPTRARDFETFTAKNILTRIQKADSGSEYKNCNEDYERLSDYLHPNCAQNLLFMTQSSAGSDLFHIGLKNPQYLRRAQYQSVHAIQNASYEILRLVSDLADPFGPPTL
jgi:hypothetical protein